MNPRRKKPQRTRASEARFAERTREGLEEWIAAAGEEYRCWIEKLEEIEPIGECERAGFWRRIRELGEEGAAGERTARRLVARREADTRELERCWPASGE